MFAQVTKNNNTFWSDNTSNEVENVMVALKFLPEEVKASLGHQFLKFHNVFDISMEDFRSKVWLVAGVHITEAQGTIAYVNKVSRKFVCISLTIASLNDFVVNSQTS